MVCIRSLVYNHEQYINDSLHGFMIQQVNFPVVILIEDDASTDKTTQILTDFVNREFEVEDKNVARVIDFEGAVTTYAQHRIKKNLHVAYIRMKYNHYGKFSRDAYNKDWLNYAKYIAICEGDDYWTHPLKLQRQVDFLEGHEEYSLCCSDVVVKSMNGDLNWSRYSESCKVPVEDIIIGGGLWLQTVSYVYRNNPGALKDYPDCCKNCHVGDYPLIIWLALHGGVYYMTEKTAVYRFQCDGSWTSKQQSIPLEKQTAGWRSEIDMLLGLDKWSQGRYSDAFSERIAKYLYNKIILPNKSDSNKIMKEFQDVKHLLSIKQRIHIFFFNIHQEETLHRLASLKKRIKNICK